MKIFGYTLQQILDLLNAWLMQFFPPKPTPTPQPTPPAPGPNPPQPTPQVTLASLVKAYNSPYVSYYPLGSTTVNSEIHKIDDATAQEVADLITKNAIAKNLVVEYFAACIMQESRFDPQCYSHNLGLTRPVASFDTTDWGMCQMNGSYLYTKPGMPVVPVKPQNPTPAEETAYEQALTEWQAEATKIAMTPSWAVPMMASIMADNLDWATRTFPTDSILTSQMAKYNTTNLTNAEFLATLAYNRGQTGAVNIIKTNDVSRMKHPYHVATWYDDFKKALATT